MRKQSSFSRNFVFIWLIFMLTDHCFRRVENGLQEPHRPVRIPQSSCSAGVSANPTLKPQLIEKPTNQIIEIKSGTSFTFSSTSCSWLLGSGSAFCSTPLWSATTSTGEEIYERQEKISFWNPFLRYMNRPVMSGAGLYDPTSIMNADTLNKCQVVFYI